MRKVVIGIAVLFWASLGMSETVTTAQDYAVDSDVVLESAVREIKSVPQDTVNIIGDAVKMVSDEMSTASKGVASVFKADPVARAEKDAALEVASAWNSDNDIIFRSYKVSEPVGVQLASGTEAEQGDGVDVSGFFSGIEFPRGASAMYHPEFNRLFVRQTLANMLFIEDALAEQQNVRRELMGRQVEIQTKFIEVNQSTLNELGFNWNFNSKNGGDANIFDNLILPANQDLLTSGLRTAGRVAAVASGSGTGLSAAKTAAFGAAVTDSDTLVLQKSSGSLNWSLVITALEQSDNADVLSAPSIVTRSGRTASIWVGEQRMLPTKFAAKSQNTSVFVENTGWKSELMGVQLEVTPELRSNNVISLKLKPRVMDLIGYDDYQVTPGNASIQSLAAGNTLLSRFGNLANTFESSTAAVGLGISNRYGNAGSGFVPSYNMQAIPVPSQRGSLPYFRLREMTTKVTVANGSTIGMGGLIYDKLETYKDKVPVLGSIPLIGRLFRSEGEKSIKRNLIIFVTATQVDVNGRRAADLVMKK